MATLIVEEDKEERRKRLARERIARYRATANGKTNNARYRINYGAALKAEVRAALGGKCACCGESHPAFLTIDHLQNDGGGRSRKLGGLGLWLKVRNEGYPADRYMLTCFNCNTGRHINGGVCPHKESINER